MLRDYRKPLVLAAPKQGLRHPLVKSDLNEMTEGTKFSPIYVDTFIKDDKKIKKIFFCSGGIYLRLQPLISGSKDHENIAIVRIEELAPFPVNEVSNALKSLHFTKNTEMYYIQEEHVNFGAFSW